MYGREYLEHCETLECVKAMRKAAEAFPEDVRSKAERKIADQFSRVEELNARRWQDQQMALRASQFAPQSAFPAMGQWENGYFGRLFG